MTRFLTSLPFTITLLFVALILFVGQAADYNPALRLKMGELSWKFQNWKAWLRSIPQRVMYLAGVSAWVASLTLVVTRADGTVERLGVVSNRVVTTAGVTLMATQLSTNTAPSWNYHDSGTGAAAEAIGNTALGTAAGPARVAGTQSNPSAGVYRTIATISYTATLAITEHGLFSASTAGTLLDRSVFAAVNVANGDSIQFQYDLTLAAGG